MMLRKYINTALNNPLAGVYMLFHMLRRLTRLEHIFFNGYSLYPDFVTLLITRRCNLNCYMCASKNPEYTRNTKAEELTTGEWKTVIDRLKWWKPAIYINGGEPFLRNDLFDIVRYCKDNALITGLTTNGSFLNDENTAKIIDSGVDFISVSIDGPQAAHDKKRGFDGAFKKAVDGLRLLIKNRKRSPHIRIASILDYDDIDNSRCVLNLGIELGVDEVAFGNTMFYNSEIRGEHLNFMRRHNFPENNMLGLQLDNDWDKKKIISLREFKKETEKESRIKVTFVPSDIAAKAFDYYSWKKPSFGSTCLTPIYSVTILPDGSVAPCQEFAVGSLRTEPFKNIWNGEKMKQLRRLRRSGPMPACFRCLEGQAIEFDR